MLQRLVTALLLLAASPAAGGALEEPWLGVYRDPDGLTIFMRQVVTKEPGMISARSADWVIRGAVDASVDPHVLKMDKLTGRLGDGAIRWSNDITWTFVGRRVSRARRRRREPRQRRRPPRRRSSVDWVGRYVDGDGLGIELARGSPTAIVATGVGDGEHVQAARQDAVERRDPLGEWRGVAPRAGARRRRGATRREQRARAAADERGGGGAATLSAPAGPVVGLLVLAAAVGFVGRSYARHGALRADLLVDDARLAAEEAKRRAPLATARARALFDARRSRAAASRASGWRRRPTPTAPRSASGWSPR